jgi:hypothetical protein
VKDLSVSVTVKCEAKLEKKFQFFYFFYSKHLEEFQHFLTSPLLSKLKKKFSFGPSEVRATSGQHLGGHYFT